MLRYVVIYIYCNIYLKLAWSWVLSSEYLFIPWTRVTGQKIIQYLVSRRWGVDQWWVMLQDELSVRAKENHRTSLIHSVIEKLLVIFCHGWPILPWRSLSESTARNFSRFFEQTRFFCCAVLAQNRSFQCLNDRSAG